MPARYYQDTAVEDTQFAWSFYRKNIIHLGTGGGKTYIAVMLILQALEAGGRILFVADQDELCEQPVRSMFKFGGIIAALEKGKVLAPLTAKVVVASAQSLSKKKRLERFPRKHFTHVIVDEAHRGCDRDAKIIEYFEDALVAGLTATPYRATVASLAKWYDNVSFSMPMMDPKGLGGGLVEKGFAPQVKLINLPVEIDLASVGTGMTPDGKEYNQEQLSTTIAPYMDAVAGMLAEHAKGRKGIAFLPLIESSKAFAAILRLKGFRAAHVDGTSSDRSEIVESMNRGELDWVVNAGVLSAGVDIPILDALLVLKPMKSMAAYQQIAGRVMRVLPGVIDHLTGEHQAYERIAAIAASAKPDVLIFDLLYQNDKLSTVSPSSLIAASLEEARAMEFAARNEPLSQQDLIALRLRIQKEIEANLVEKLERSAAKQKSTSPLAAKELAAIIGWKNLIDYTPIEKWQLDPPSRAQLELIENFGIIPSSITSKGEATAFISAMRWRRTSGLATIKQVRLMRALNEGGHIKDQDFASVEFADASRIIQAGLAERSRKAMTQ